MVKDKRWTPARRAKIIDMYLAGKPMAEIAKAVKTDIASVRIHINGQIKALNNAYATRSAAGNQWNPSGADLRFSNTELINEEFTKLLSDPHDPDAMLTLAEMKFCELYTATGDGEFACIRSGLDAGLFTEKEIKGGKRGAQQREFAETYHASVKIRVAYLRRKPNIQKQLKILEDDGNIDPRNVNKEYLQKIILTEIDRLGGLNSPEMKKLSRDYVQMLGRTFGGFTEKIEIGMVDHKKSLLKLREATQHDELAELRAKKEAELQRDKTVNDDGLDRS